MSKTGTLDIGRVRQGRLAKSIAGSTTPVQLSLSESENLFLDFSGAITANIEVRPDPAYFADGDEWVLFNGTTGAFTVTFKGATGNGVTVPQGGWARVRYDGANIVQIAAGYPLSGADVGTVAAGNVVGGVPVLHVIAIPAGATGDVDTVLTYKTRIFNAWLAKTNAAGGGAGSVQVKNGANAITDAMSINVADQTVVRCGTIDDAQHEIAAGGTLRATRTRTASTDETCLLYVEGVRVP